MTKAPELEPGGLAVLLQVSPKRPSIEVVRFDPASAIEVLAEGRDPMFVAALRSNSLRAPN